MKTVVIFGGSGFIGQHIIRRIAKNGYIIIVPYQRSVNEAKLRFFGDVGQVIPIKFTNIRDEKIIKSIEFTDVIVNLKTVWQKKTLSFQKEIKQFNIDLVSIINKIDKNKLFIFFTGLDISKNSTSERTSAIFEAEYYIKNNSINSCIIRPGVVIGEGDQFLRRLLSIIKISFFVPIFGKGKSKLQPVYVDDVAKAVEQIISSKLKGCHIFELVGSEIFTYRSFYLYLIKCLKVKRFLISVPFIFAKIIVLFIEKVPISLLTMEQLLLLKKDNLPSNIDKNFNYLGIELKNIRQIIQIYIKKSS